MKKVLSILFIVLFGALLSILFSDNSVPIDSMPVSAGTNKVCYGECYGPQNFALSDYNDRYTELLAIDVSQLGNVAANLRLMVKLAAKQIYQTSVYCAKDAVRRIAEYMQHQSFISENLNSNKFRVGMAGKQVQYLYQLCRIVI